ncbi:MAG: 3-dehydroquinate synthase [Candidatus Heimdallarchaeota archaeon]|nr:3-dehydroquinate synthase [Candidatus Heimdallarchaeota archaeon]
MCEKILSEFFRGSTPALSMKEGKEMNISLIGYRGVGKTTLGKLLAKDLQKKFIDTDTLIEQEIGMSIKDFFALKGEIAFRKIETIMVDRVLSKEYNAIISFGGGVVLNPKNIFHIRNHSKVIFLDVDEETIYNRIKNSQRPALTAFPLKKEIQHTLAQRRPLYLKSSDIVLQLTHRPLEFNLERLKKCLKENRIKAEMRRINYQSNQLENYSIFIRKGLFNEIAKICNVGNRYLIICDSNIHQLFANRLKQLFDAENKECSILSFPAGEENKQLKTFCELQEQIALSLDRQSCVLAFGGGVTGDLAGFVASTYMRGIPFVQIPTSLLAMIDSSVGGKVGVNTSKGKNCVGVFTNPSKVFIDPLLLTTLPKENFVEGLAEAVKHGLIESRDYFDFLLKNSSSIQNLEMNFLTKLIFDSISIKLSFVQQDEKEAGRRKMLNFGHTVGHALEELIGYGNISHGQAVSIGMVAAAFLSWKRGMISRQQVNLIEHGLTKLELPISLRELDLHCSPECVYEFILHDKKTIGNQITFILLQDIGKATIITDVTKEEILEMVHYVS